MFAIAIATVNPVIAILRTISWANGVLAMTNRTYPSDSDCHSVNINIVIFGTYMKPLASVTNGLIQPCVKFTMNTQNSIRLKKY